MNLRPHAPGNHIETFPPQVGPIREGEPIHVDVLAASSHTPVPAQKLLLTPDRLLVGRLGELPGPVPERAEVGCFIRSHVFVSPKRVSHGPWALVVDHATVVFVGQGDMSAAVGGSEGRVKGKKAEKEEGESEWVLHLQGWLEESA